MIEPSSCKDLYMYHVVVHMYTPTQAGNQAFLYIWELVSKYMYKSDTETKESMVFRNLRALGCSDPNAARVLLRA